MSQPLARKNLRRTNRYTVSMDLHYRPLDAVTPAQWVSGRALDMSAGGILMDTNGEIAVGTLVEVLIAFPGIYHRRAMIRLHVTGPIVRSDSKTAAVQIATHEFRDACPVQMRPARPAKTLAVA